MAATFLRRGQPSLCLEKGESPATARSSVASASWAGSHHIVVLSLRLDRPALPAFQLPGGYTA